MRANRGRSYRIPRRVDRAQRRARIADAILRIAATRGLDEVSLRDVAAEAGVSMGQVQHYFATKSEMLKFACAYMVEQTRQAIADALGDGPQPAQLEDQPARARLAHREALALARELGDMAGIAHILQGLGDAERAEGAFEEAQRLKEEGLELLRRLGDKTCTASTLAGLGMLAHVAGDDQGALTRLRESLALGRELDDRGALALALEGLAAVFTTQSAWAPAARALGAAEALRQAGSAPLMPYERATRDQTAHVVRSCLGEAVWAGHYADGRKRAMEQALLSDADVDL